MAGKKNNYIGVDLEYAEEQLATWKKYMDDNPIDQLEDRWGRKEMPKGGFAMVVTSTRENQIKCVQDTFVRYLQMLEVVERLREKEESKPKSARGGADVPFRMRKKEDGQDESES